MEKNAGLNTSINGDKFEEKIEFFNIYTSDICLNYHDIPLPVDGNEFIQFFG